MNQKQILKNISILRAQLDLLKANAEAIDTALTVLEKEVAGSGMPATSSKKKHLQEIAAQVVAKRRARIEKMKNNHSGKNSH